MEIIVDGYKIHYKITGTGEKTIVILQGWGTELATYDSVAASVSGKYRVVQLDLPGFGASEEPQEGWDVEKFADFFVHFLEALQITKTSLIGHSYGGRMIIRLASREQLPFEIEKIVLIDSAGILPQKSLKQKMKIRRYKILKKLINLKLMEAFFPGMAEEWRNRQGSADYRNATPVMRQCLVKAVNEDLTDRLSKIRQETLLIWGDLDTATPLADGKKMNELIKGSGLVVLEGTGHYSFLEKPVIFDRVMKSFFKVEE